MKNKIKKENVYTDIDSMYDSLPEMFKEFVNVNECAPKVKVSSVHMSTVLHGSMKQKVKVKLKKKLLNNAKKKFKKFKTTVNFST